MVPFSGPSHFTSLRSLYFVKSVFLVVSPFNVLCLLTSHTSVFVCWCMHFVWCICIPFHSVLAPSPFCLYISPPFVICVPALCVHFIPLICSFGVSHIFLFWFLPFVCIVACHLISFVLKLLFCFLNLPNSILCSQYFVLVSCSLLSYIFL
jgi:hypothetical protein